MATNHHNSGPALSLAALFGACERRDELPPCPQLAVALGLVWQRLGGNFGISSNGHRGMGQPLCLPYDDARLPTVRPDVDPCDCFHSEKEWQGALKLLRVLIAGLAQSDRDYLFELFGVEAIDPRRLAPSIEEPKRGAA